MGPKYPLVIVDGENLRIILRQLIKNGPAQIDTRKFRTLLTEGQNPPKAFARWYMPIWEKGARRQPTETFARILQHTGWHTVTKVATPVYGGDNGEITSYKANMDVEIAWDVAGFFFSPKLNDRISRLVVVGGDRDFIVFLNEAHERRIPVSWVASHHNLAGDIRRALRHDKGDKLVMIEDILTRIVLENGEGFGNGK